VGVASALGVVAFYEAIDLAYAAFVRWPASFASRGHFLFYRPVLTGGALALAWTVWRRLGRGGDGAVVPDVQLAVVRRGGRVPLGPTLGRTLASAITLGGGGSAGTEGPVVVLGAAVGSLLGRAFRFARERTTVLVGAGGAAAIAAAFNAPLAGAFFALEEILGDFRVGSFPPVVIASVVGAVVSRAVFGNHPAFPIPREYGYAVVREVVFFFPLLGVVCGVVSALFVRTYFAVGARLGPWLSPPADAPRARRRWAALVPWAAGALVGLAVYASGGFLVGTGHFAIPLAAFGRLAWWALLLLALGKIVVTSVTLHGGGSGGLFTPSLFVGAATGGAVGVALRGLFPGIPITPEAYAIVGMGALVAGATGAPITGILLVFEMTNDYALVIPLMVAVVVTQLVTRKLSPDNLYSGWLRRRGEHIEQGADRDVLAGLRVADACEREAVVVPEGAPVAHLLEHLGHRDQSLFPVVDDAGDFVGVLTTADLGQVARSGHALDEVLVAADVARPIDVLAPGDSLLEAVRRMGVRGEASLPVVDPATGRLFGVVTRSRILGLYERAVAAEPDPRA
jgi:CIC family chloride channel protein